jgi:hypothetical protein
VAADRSLLLAGILATTLTALSLAVFTKWCTQPLTESGEPG